MCCLRSPAIALAFAVAVAAIVTSPSLSLAGLRQRDCVRLRRVVRVWTFEILRNSGRPISAAATLEVWGSPLRNRELKSEGAVALILLADLR